MARGLVIVIAVGVVVAAAVVEGLRSNRWGASEEIRAAADRLDRVPREFGDWVGTELPQDPRSLKVAEAAGCVSRGFANRKTGERVEVLILCGPAGPIGAHTPDVCYGGIGYACVGDPARKSVVPNGGTPATFWTARFEKTRRADDPLRVYWAWGTDGDWEASPNPRGEFALRGALY